MTRKGSQVRVLYGPPRLTCEYRAFHLVLHPQVHRNWALCGAIGGEIECSAAVPQLRFLVGRMIFSNVVLQPAAHSPAASEICSTAVRWAVGKRKRGLREMVTV